VNSLNKILPLVLVLSISLIIGNQAAFAQTDVWGLYCEEASLNNGEWTPDLTNMGAEVDSFEGATGSDVDPNCALFAGAADNYIRLPWGDAGDNPGIVYKSISEKNAIDNDPDIKVKCFAGVPDPKTGGNYAVDGQFDWNFNDPFNNLGNLAQARAWDCIDNFRADNDLGIGVDDPAKISQPLEVQNDQLVALFIGDLIDAGYFDFMFIISSNSPGENTWLATADFGPSGIITEATVGLDVIGDFPGCDEPCGNNDQYISLNNPKDWLYYKQVGFERDNLIQQIKAKIVPDIVGGHGGPIDKTALMVTGAQLNASWMIPVLISAIGIGVFVVTRKS